MYALIVCSHCGGTSQVDASALGKMVRCPLCGQPTLGQRKEPLPVAEPLPEAAPTQPEPLSLDDAEQLPPPPVPRPAPAPIPAPAPPPRIPTKVLVGISFALTLLAVFGVYTAFQYGSGDIPESAWRDFAPPEGHFRVRLPGDPVEEEVDSQFPGVLGGKRWAVRRWFEKVQCSVGWLDLDPATVDERTFARLVAAERDRRLQSLPNAAVTRPTGTLQLVSHGRRYDGYELQIESGTGLLVERFYLVPGPRPRVYVLSISGARLKPEGGAVGRFFNSFELEEN